MSRVISGWAWPWRWSSERNRKAKGRKGNEQKAAKRARRLFVETLEAKHLLSGLEALEVDTTPPRIISSSVTPNAILAPGSMSIQIAFSEPMTNINLENVTDFSLRGVFHGIIYSLNGFSLNPDGTVLTLNYTDLPDDNYVLTVVAGISGGTNFTDVAGNALDGEFSGTFPSGNGVAGGDFVLSFSKDLVSEAYPTPLSPKSPLGSLIYDPMVTRTIAFAGDTDSFTLNLDPGQTISVLVNQTNGGLRPIAQVRGPAGEFLAGAQSPAAGTPVFLNGVPAANAGTYTITVAGFGTTRGRYVAQVIVNGALEAENNGGQANDSRATAQNINSSFIEVATPSYSAFRGAVVGGNAASAGWNDHYSFSVTGGTTLSVVFDHWTGSGANVFLENSAGGILAEGTAGAANYERGIRDLLILSSGTYFVRVSGAAAATYSAVIIRGGTFDTEGNDTFAGAQSLVDTSAVLGAIAPLSGAAIGSTVVPANLAGVEGNSNAARPFPQASARYQQIYAANQFTTAGFIDAIRFRRDASQGPFTTSGLVVQINLAYAAMPIAAPSVVFADNVGGGNLTVYDGPLTLSSNGTGNPRPFDVVIDVADVFYYDPALGDLLLDVRVLSNASANFLLDASSVTQQSSTVRIYNNVAGNVAGNVGGANEGQPFGLVTRFDFREPTVNDDWYSIPVVQWMPNLRLETSTPAGGPGEFVNRLDPRLELYDSSGHLVAVGMPQADGRNETLQFHAPISSPETYRLRVTSESNSFGEYFLSAIASENEPAVATNDSAITGEDAVVTIDVLANDTDADGQIDPASLMITDPPAHGSVSIDPETGLVVYTPNPNYSGPDSIVYLVRDDNGAGSFAVVAITVVAAADAPTLTVADAAGVEGTLIPLDVAAALTDTDGSEALSVQISGVPLGAYLTRARRSGDVWIVSAEDLAGLAMFVPDEASFTLVVTAIATEGSNADAASSPAETMQVTVSNAAPANLILDPIEAIEEGGVVSFAGLYQEPGSLDQQTVVIDWGPGEETTTLRSTEPVPPGMQLIQFGASWLFFVQHQYRDDNPSGTSADDYQITVTATDDDGGSTTTTASVTVSNVAPELSISPPPSIEEGGTTTLSGTISDVGELDTFTVIIDWGNGTETFTDVAAGPFQFTRTYADDSGPGAYPLQITVIDDDGGSAGAATSVTVSNVAPTAVSDQYSVAQAGALTGNVITDAGGADFDPAGASDPLTVVSHSDPSHGTLILNSDGSFSYVPELTFAGTDSFTYVITDGDGGLSTATVSIVVTPASPGSILLVDDTRLPGTALLITGTSEGDSIVVLPGFHSSKLVVIFNGNPTVVTRPTGRIIVAGGAGNDIIHMAGAISNPVWLYGEAGNDYLNASNGGSLLIGGAGNDLLLGGNGRDVLIGGEGADLLHGNGNDDILVAGLTLLDDRAQAHHEEFWRQVLEEWTSDNSFATRVENLRTGTGATAHNDGSLLLPNVRDDSAIDAIDFLSGASGNDWLILLATEDKAVGKSEAAN